MQGQKGWVRVPYTISNRYLGGRTMGQKPHFRATTHILDRPLSGAADCPMLHMDPCVGFPTEIGEDISRRPSGHRRKMSSCLRYPTTGTTAHRDAPRSDATLGWAVMRAVGLSRWGGPDVLHV